MLYYLTIVTNGINETIKYDNEMAYYLKITDLRKYGYTIEYDCEETCCYATSK